MRGKTDIVFFSYGFNETDRYLPVMADLKRRGVNCLLFYLNYNWHDGLNRMYQAIIKEHGIAVTDYSAYMPSYVLWLLTAVLRVWPHNKIRGLRSKLMAREITYERIHDIFDTLNPKAVVFDCTDFTQPRNYPYGAYYFNKAASIKGIKKLGMLPGGSIWEGEFKMYAPTDSYMDTQKAAKDRILAAKEGR